MIFWEHTKGLNQLNSADAWTYINYIGHNNSSGVDANEDIISNVTRLMSGNPSIGFGIGGYADLDNHILTSEMTSGHITNSFSFYNSVLIKNGTDNPTLTLVSASDGSQISATHALGLDVPASTKLTLRQGGTSNEKITINADGSLDLKGATTITGQFTVGSSDSANDIKAFGKCEALYFNAISDYRAKKDFKPLQVDALKLIQKIQPYSFKYKDSNTPSIGIIAQDVQDIDIEGFKLVDNENATGENMDYMSIHESKLIYILWKAIQEQQKEIEELKSKLK